MKRIWENIKDWFISLVEAIRGLNDVSVVLMLVYWFFLIVSVGVVVRIIYIQYFWEPDPKYVNYFIPKKVKQTVSPLRGNILDCNGKILAISYRMCDIKIDTKAHLNEFRSEPDSIARVRESNWRDSMKVVCNRMAEYIGRESTGEDYYNAIMTRRDNPKAARNMYLERGIDNVTTYRISHIPAVRRKYFTGIILEDHFLRDYPYKGLARRLIGDVRIDPDSVKNNRYKGIEGKYDYALRGKDGYMWMKLTDKESLIADPDSVQVAVVNGSDIVTTLDVDMQMIADRAIRNVVEDDPVVKAACAVVMDVKTGAVKAMANLSRNKKGELGEYFNYSIAHASEPGSVFKTVTLAMALEANHIKLDDEIPTNGGDLKIKGLKPDETVIKYEKITGKRSMSVLTGFEKSTNYIFRKIAYDLYDKDRDAYLQKLYEYNLGDCWSFDVSEDGGTNPAIPEKISTVDLISCAIGYTVKETPLNILAFYNAIAGRGKMMKPYMIDSIVEDGHITQKFKPQVLNASIFSEATVDTLTRALKMVTFEGTASRRLKNAHCTVAGKTGTAHMILEKEERGKSKDPRMSEDGRRRYQATFVGFFPADNPKYSAIVSVYTYLTDSKSYGGGSTAAQIFRDMVDNIWALDSTWGKIYPEIGEVPQMN